MDKVPFGLNRVTEIVKNCLGIQISSRVSHSCIANPGHCCWIMTLYLTCLERGKLCLAQKIHGFQWTFLWLILRFLRQFSNPSTFSLSRAADVISSEAKVASFLNVFIGNTNASPSPDRDTCHKAILTKTAGTELPLFNYRSYQPGFKLCETYQSKAKSTHANCTLKHSRLVSDIFIKNESWRS